MLFSVIVQGGLIPTVARRCRVQMDDVEPRPWAVGLRVRDEPRTTRQYRIDPDAPAVGQAVRDVHDAYDVWISVVVRDGHTLRVHADTVLRADDEVLVLAEPDADISTDIPRQVDRPPVRAAPG